MAHYSFLRTVVMVVAFFLLIVMFMATLTQFSRRYFQTNISNKSWSYTDLLKNPQLFYGSASSIRREPLIVHYVLLHETRNPGPESYLSFMECMSVLSVMQKLAPDAIYLHTNVPEFWPFVSCKAYIKNWAGVESKPAPLRRFIGGKKIHGLSHEADIRKLEILHKYGGLVVDFDVFMVNGNKLRNLLFKYPCIICSDVVRKHLNGGFMACKKGSVYPRLILEKSYMADYRPSSWLWNIGEMPYKLLQKHSKTAHIARGICDRPNAGTWDRRKNYKWEDEIAIHSYFHNRNFTEASLKHTNSSFGDLLNWILMSAPLSRKLPKAK